MRRWVPIAILLLCLGLTAASLVLVLTDPTKPELGEAVLGLIVLPLLFVGTVVARRQPENVIGWLLLAAGFMWTLSAFADTYLALPRRLPAQLFIGWLGTWSWFVAMAGLSVMIFLFFPTGKLVSARWRPVVWLGAITAVIGAIGMATDPLEMSEGWVNPVGSNAPLFEAMRAASNVFLLIFAASVLSLIIRFRRATGVERQQLKWLVFGAAILAIAISLAAIEITELLGSIGWFTALTMAIMGIPVIIGMAILRYRLYDIDVVINKTLVYGALSALLALVYLALVTAISTVVGESEVVTAASTLAVATLFNPLRRRVQEQVDHLFYRRKYDAQRTVEAFTDRLRAEIDLDSVNAELIDTVHRTMHPEHISVWLRTGAEA